jgi:hypothetical protein
VSSFGDSIQKFRDKLGSIGKKGGDGGSSGGGAKFDAKKTMAWLKRNPLIVASVAVMVLAPATAWWFSSQMHADHDKQTEERAKEMASLEKLEKTQVEIALPGREPSQQTGVVTPKMVAAYEELTRKLREDAVAVQKTALIKNQKARTKLTADIAVRPNNVNTVAETVLNTLRKSVEDALVAARAGIPPDEDKVIDQVQRRQDQFISGEKKTDRKSLTAEELDKLNRALAEKRLQVYADSAATVSFYADIQDLGLPTDPKSAGATPSESKMFYWQWRTWIVEDVIRAVVAANKPYRSVVDSPVKRIVALRFLDEKSFETVAAPAAAAAPGSALGGGAPAEGAVDPAAAATGPPPIDPKNAVPYDFVRSFTGRQTNSLYDVRKFRVTLVVATAGLPDILNAIAKENFMTVVNISMQPADAFADAAEGYIYGPDPVSMVNIDVESVWLREWMGKLMPKEMQAHRGTNGRTVDEAMTPPAGAENKDAEAKNG